MILIDTDILIDYLRGYPPAQVFVDTTLNVAITPFSRNELLLGARNAADFERIRKKTDFPLVWLHNDLVELVAEIIKKHHLKDGTDHIDSWNAAAALHYQVPLYTRNIKHYQNIEGLRIVRPY